MHLHQRSWGVLFVVALVATALVTVASPPPSASALAVGDIEVISDPTKSLPDQWGMPPHNGEFPAFTGQRGNTVVFPDRVDTVYGRAPISWSEKTSATEVIYDYPTHADAAAGAVPVALSPDERWVVTRHSSFMATELRLIDRHNSQAPPRTIFTMSSIVWGLAIHGVAVSADGAKVAIATNVAVDSVRDTGAGGDVYIWSRDTGATTLATVATGDVAAGYSPGSGATSVHISDDGRWVAFNFAANVSGPAWATGGYVAPTDASVDAAVQITDGFISDITGTGKYVLGTSSSTPATLRLFSRDSDDNGIFDDSIPWTATVGDLTSAPGGYGSFGRVSRDGVHVAYATTVKPGGGSYTHSQVLVRNTSGGGSTTRITDDGAGNPGNGPSFVRDISGDGTLVTFSSSATNLDPADTNSNLDIYAARFQSEASLDVNAIVGCAGPVNRQGGQGCDRVASKSDPVNTLNGAFEDSVTDLASTSRGVPFNFTRTYSSANTASGMLGTGWATSYDAALVETSPGGPIDYQTGTGATIRFDEDSDTYTPIDPTPLVLTATLGGWELRSPSGHVDHFDGDGLLTAQLDPSGRGTTITRHLDGTLDTVTDEAGRVATFTHTSDRVTSISMSDGRSVSYSYSGDLLTEVEDVTGGDTTYRYGTSGPGDGLIEEVTDPDGVTIVENTYDSNGRVTTQTTQGGGTATFTWDPDSTIATYTETGRGSWVDVYDNGAIVEERDPEGGVVSYTYDDNHQLSAVTDQVGATTSYTRDVNGRIVSQHGPVPGTVTTWVWNNDGTLASHTDPSGATTSYTYSGALVTRIDYADTAFEEFTRDPLSGLVTEHLDRGGNTTTFTYDGSGNVTSIVTPAGRTTTFTYDAAGNVTSQVDGRGNELGADPDDYRWLYDPDPAGRVEAITSPGGKTTTTTRSGAGRPLTLEQPGGAETTWDYTLGQLSSVEGPDLAETVYTRDAFGNRTGRSQPGALDDEFTYDDANELIEHTSPANGATVTTRDKAGRPTRVLGANGTTAPVLTGSSEGPLFTGTPNSGFAYPITKTGTSTPISLSCGAEQRVLWYTPGLGADELWMNIAVPAPTDTGTVTYDIEPVTVDGTYTPAVGDFDGDGCDDILWYAPGVTADTLWYFDTDGTWDDVPVTMDDTATPVVGQFDGWLDDGLDDILWYKPGIDDETIWKFSARGTFSVEDAPQMDDTYTPVPGPHSGSILWYSPTDPSVLWHYFEAGYTWVDQASVDLPSGYEITTSGGRPILHDGPGDDTVIDAIDPWAYPPDITTLEGETPAATTWSGPTTARATYSVLHDPTTGDGYLLDHTRPEPTATNSGVNYTYDAAGHVTGIDYDDPATPDVAYTYDGRGLRSTMTDGTGVRVYTHDQMGHLVEITHDPDGPGPAAAASEFTYTYDANGRLETRTHNGVTVTWTRDLDGYVTAISDGTNSTTYTLDGAGNTTGVAHPNGTVEAFTWNADGRLEHHSVTDATPQTIIDRAYTYDTAGRVASITDTAAGAATPNQSFTYDASGRLTAQCRAVDCGVTPSALNTWTYDGAGRRLTATTDAGTTTYTYDPATGRLTDTTGPDGTVTYTYDAEGNRISADDGADTTTYTYDAAGRASTVTDTTGTTSFAYDGDGNRVTVTDPGDTTTAVTWDPNSGYPMPVTAGDTTLVWAPGGSPAWADIDGDIQVTHTDQVRSPIAVTDTTGELTHRVVTDPWGVGTIDVMDPLAAAPAVGFSSTLTAFNAAGTVHMRARDYDPQVGAFTTVDPWRRPDGSPWVDVYQYTDGDPVMFWDPTGLAQARTNGSTFGWCANGAIAFIIAFTASGCIAIDTNGGFGVTGTVGAGAGLPEVSATTGPFISSADHVRDLNGVGQWAAAGAGEGVVGGIAGSHGEACNGDHVWTVSPEGGVGLTLPFFPVSGGGGVSRTGVLASGGTSCD